MSFRVWKREEKATPGPSAPSASRAELPMDVVDAGADRLAVVALLTACIVVLLAVGNRQVFSRFGAASLNPTLWVGAMAASLLLSLAVAWIAWRRMLAPATLLDVGLVYEVTQSFCIALTFHEVPATRMYSVDVIGKRAVPDWRAGRCTPTWY